jgi:hypothetical protein
MACTHSIPAHSLTDSSQTVSDILSQCQARMHACIPISIGGTRSFVNMHARTHVDMRACMHACMLACCHERTKSRDQMFHHRDGHLGKEMCTILSPAFLLFQHSFHFDYGMRCTHLIPAMYPSDAAWHPLSICKSSSKSHQSLTRNSATQPVGERRKARETPRRNSLRNSGQPPHVYSCSYKFQMKKQRRSTAHCTREIGWRPESDTGPAQSSSSSSMFVRASPQSSDACQSAASHECLWLDPGGSLLLCFDSRVKSSICQVALGPS